MNGLLTLTLCALSVVPLISTFHDSLLDSSGLEATTRDVYGSWTLGEEEETAESEESSEATDSPIRKSYWFTHYWRTAGWESVDAERSPRVRGMNARYSYRGTRAYSRRIRRNRTTRLVTGRWPSRRNNGIPHSVRPGFGRPRRNSTTVKLITPGFSRRRVPRMYYTFRSRASPYFYWHTPRNENATGSRIKIRRGPRRSYGTRKPRRPNRFQWISRFHRTRVYPGNLTCRLFIVRNRTSSILFGPHRTATTPSVDPYASTLSYPSGPIVGISAPSSANTSTEPYPSRSVNATGALSSTAKDKHGRTRSMVNHTGTLVTNIPLLQNGSLAIANFTAPITNESTTEDEFPDISYKLKYSIESAPDYNNL